MNSYLLFTDWLWHGCWQHNFPPPALCLQYIFAKKNKIFAVFCTAKLKGQGLTRAVALFYWEVEFFVYFFFLKRKIRKKKSFGHLSDLFFGMYFSLWVLIFLGYLPGCFFIPDIETFYWYYTTSLLVQSTKWDELQILLLFVDSSFKFF